MPYSLLPESLFIQTAPALQETMLQGSAGRHTESFGKTLLVRVMQLEQIGIACTIGEIFIAGPDLVHQLLTKRGDSEPDLASGHVVYRQLLAITGDEVLEQFAGGFQVVLKLLPSHLGLFTIHRQGAHRSE